MPESSRPPYAFGHDIPSQPRSASFRMKARFAGVSTVCESCSGFGSITSGEAFSRRKASTSASKARSSGVNSKSTALPLLLAQLRARPFLVAHRLFHRVLVAVVHGGLGRG